MATKHISASEVISPKAHWGLIDILDDRGSEDVAIALGKWDQQPVLAMRWNVVIGGQLFSKSFLGYTTYKMGFATREGLLPAIVILILPFIILAVLVRILPPWTKGGDKHVVKA